MAPLAERLRRASGLFHPVPLTMRRTGLVLRIGSRVAIASVLLCLPGCGDDAGVPRLAPLPAAPNPAPAATNQRPIADAGPTQRAREGDTVVLNGAGSRDPDGTIVSYRWTPRVENAVTVVLQNPETATPSFTVPDLEEDTTFVFDLVVTDDRGASSSDAAEVFVTTYDDM